MTKAHNKLNKKKTFNKFKMNWKYKKQKLIQNINKYNNSI